MRVDRLYLGDCFELHPQIKDSTVNLILCDIPYGVTKDPNDIPLHLPLLWEQYKRILAPKGNIVLTSQFPYLLDVVNSNRPWFRYDLIWDKQLPTGFLNANKMPLRVHEHILIFYPKPGTYNPQYTKGPKTHSRGKNPRQRDRVYGSCQNMRKYYNEDKHPQSILHFPKSHASKAKHPTEKPVELFKYLVKTYSNEGDLVLDSCVGSGTTPVACTQTNRHFIGIDINPECLSIARKRLAQQVLEVGA